MLGYEDLAKDKEVELLNLSKNPIVECHTTIGTSNIKLAFSKKLIESDLLINVPKLKYHRLPKVTCSMKNIFGAIAKPYKFSYHPHLAKTIVAANKIIQSDIILVDALIALGKYPKIMKTILLGQDALAMDKACSRIMGFNPNGVTFIRLGEKEKIGMNHRSKIIGEATLEELKELFPSVSYLKQNITWDLQLWMVKKYARITGDTIPPILLKE